MSDQEGFLKRWSRRKHEAADETRAPQEHAEDRSADGAASTPAAVATVQPAPLVAETPPSNAFDPATLPPIDSITAGTDIRAFLQKGVPPDLTRAALRRAWVADPAIRDFVGLSENAWDFNAPDGVPGFGPLAASEDVKQMVNRIVSDPQGEARPPDRSALSETGSDAPEPNNSPGPAQADPPVTVTAQVDSRVDVASGDNARIQSKPNNAAAQNDDDADGKLDHPRQRGHGGALPT